MGDVLLHWAGLGYYSRARNIHKAACQIVAQGRFSANREEWLEIPGVGNYTAGAILSIALGHPEAILDGNVERVLSRFRRISRSNGDTFYKGRLWRLSRIFVEKAFGHGIDPRVTNQALMELGATICTPRNPKCLLCPLQGGCRARHFNEEAKYPPKKKPKQWIEVQEELHCVLGQDGRVLLRLREKGEWRSGLFDLLDDLPSGHERLAAIGEIESKHIVTRHKITRKTRIWRIAEAPLWKASESSELKAVQLKWVDPFQPEVAIGSALKKTLNQIRETFPEAWLASSEPEVASSRWD